MLAGVRLSCFRVANHLPARAALQTKVQRRGFSYGGTAPDDRQGPAATTSSSCYDRLPVQPHSGVRGSEGRLQITVWRESSLSLQTVIIWFHFFFFFLLLLFLLFFVRTESVQLRQTLDSWHFLLVKFVSYLFLVPYPSSFPFSNSLCPFPLLLSCSSGIGPRITHVLAMRSITELRKDPHIISLCVSEKGTCLACVWGRRGSQR